MFHRGMVQVLVFIKFLLGAGVENNIHKPKLTIKKGKLLLNVLSTSPILLFFSAKHQRSVNEYKRSKGKVNSQNNFKQNAHW